MKRLNIYQKFLLLFLLSVTLQSCVTFRQEYSVQQNPIDSVFASKFFNATQAAVSVYDLTDNKSIYKHNEKFLMHPASNQKILTTTAAYLFLGKDYKFKTEVLHTGEIKDSVCIGDLYFIGGFDPDFSLHDLDSLVRQIKSFGIKEVKGNLYGDVSAMDSLFWGNGWMWDDDPYSFLPYLTSLNINKDNVMVVTSPSEINKPAFVNLNPQTNFFEIKNSSVTTDTGRNKLIVTRDWINRKNTIFDEGSINKSSVPDTTMLNVFNPAIYFLNLSKESCQRNRIRIDGRIDTLTLQNNGELIFSAEHSIDSVIRTANKNSDNLNAEMLLRAIANKYFGKHSSAKEGLKFVDSLITLAGFNPKNYLLVDGSGLSHYNLVSADLITGILKYVYYYHPEIYKSVFNSFPISGYDGTLRNRMKNMLMFKRVHGKTGTLSGISCLSGYIESKNNHLIAFSILIQNYLGSAKKAHDIQDKLCELIYQMN